MDIKILAQSPLIASIVIVVAVVVIVMIVIIVAVVLILVEVVVVTEVVPPKKNSGCGSRSVNSWVSLSQFSKNQYTVRSI